MADLGPQSLGYACCPHCGSMVLVNRSGVLRHHRAPKDSRPWMCPGSYQPAPGGSVRVLKLKDGVVIKVTHAPGTLADEAVTDELVLLAAEWDELVKVITGEAGSPAPE
jgi:hypothetical protein